ncbi:MAG: NUDIX hydrolase [Chloroflexi bacterium]|nr:NUDIX hydrolase [Chloroflexota bacterium]
MSERIRYQGAIIRDDYILLIKHRHHADGRAYWIIPGGGREDGETEEECVVREMREETNLDVAVEKLLFEESLTDGNVSWYGKTYWCRVVGGEAKPGYEPEIEASSHYGIVAVAWFDLRHPENWEPLLINDWITFPLVQKIQKMLGY